MDEGNTFNDSQGYREVVVGRVDHVDGRDCHRAPLPADGAAAAHAQRRAAAALARRLPAPQDWYVHVPSGVEPRVCRLTVGEPCLWPRAMTNLLAWHFS